MIQKAPIRVFPGKAATPANAASHVAATGGLPLVVVARAATVPATSPSRPPPTGLLLVPPVVGAVVGRVPARPFRARETPTVVVTSGGLVVRVPARLRPQMVVPSKGGRPPKGQATPNAVVAGLVRATVVVEVVMGHVAPVIPARRPARPLVTAQDN